MLVFARPQSNASLSYDRESPRADLTEGVIEFDGNPYRLSKICYMPPRPLTNLRILVCLLLTVPRSRQGTLSRTLGGCMTLRFSCRDVR